jgi:hypothetical protein
LWHSVDNPHRAERESLVVPEHVKSDVYIAVLEYMHGTEIGTYVLD